MWLLLLAPFILGSCTIGLHETAPGEYTPADIGNHPKKPSVTVSCEPEKHGERITRIFEESRVFSRIGPGGDYVIDCRFNVFEDALGHDMKLIGFILTYGLYPMTHSCRYRLDVTVSSDQGARRFFEYEHEIKWISHLLFTPAFPLVLLFGASETEAREIMAYRFLADFEQALLREAP